MIQGDPAEGVHAPVGALERVEDEGGFAHAPGCLAGRMRREPVVGEHRIRSAVLQAVLEQRHIHPRHLFQPPQSSHSVRCR